MRYVQIVICSILILAASGHARCAEVPRAQAAIVKVRASIASDARTADALGKNREGNGVVIDAEGLILTIGYLILEAETIEVVRPDGESVMAAYVGYDHATGFGLIKAVHRRGLVPIEMGRSSMLETGDPVLLVGYGPNAIRPANIIARREFVGYWEYLLEDALYASPPHPEFAGAVMMDADGRLVGIGSIYTRLDFPPFGSVPCNMFVPIDLLKPILEDLVHNGRSAAPPKPWLGVNAEETRGRVFIDRVHAQGPAELAGLQANDMVLNVNREAVTGLADFYRKVWALGQAGVRVPLTILHGNHVKEVEVHSSDRHHYLRIRPTLKAPKAILEKSI